MHFFIDSMYHVSNNQDGSKKYSFRSNQNMGFIKEDQLNTIMNGYCFCIWWWSWSYQEKNIREERWIWSGGEQGQRRTLKDELGPFSLPQSSHCNDVSILWERKEQHAGLQPHASSVRQQISNMCELPLCLVSALFFWAQRQYGCFTSAFQICVTCPWCPMWTCTMYGRKFWEM